MAGNHIIVVKDEWTEIILFHKILKEENLDEQS